MDTETIYPQIKVILADVLALEEDEIEPKGSLINDYGAESIDLLDLLYRLEREFKVKIPRGQIEVEARGPLSEEEFEHKGRLTEAGMARLREFLAEVPADRFKDGMRASEIPTLFTPETFCKLVLRAQANAESA